MAEEILNNKIQLSKFVNNRVKLMQEVLSVIKPKKLILMAPNCIKNMQLCEIKSLLMEELLGISNKRLLSIFAGENMNADSTSSTDESIYPENDAMTIYQNVEIDDDVVQLVEVKSGEDEPIVSVLNLLELQARARAIRSQLINENDKNVDQEKTNDLIIQETKSDDEN